MRAQAFEIDGIADGCSLVLIAEPCYFCEQQGQGPPRNRKTWRLVGYALNNLRHEIEQKRLALETVAVAPGAAAAAAAIPHKRLSLVLDIDETFGCAVTKHMPRQNLRITQKTAVYRNELAEPGDVNRIGFLEAGAEVEVVEIIPQIAKHTAPRPSEKAVHYKMVNGTGPLVGWILETGNWTVVQNWTDAIQRK